MISFVVYIHIFPYCEHGLSSIPAFQLMTTKSWLGPLYQMWWYQVTIVRPPPPWAQYASMLGRESSGAGSHCSINLITFHFYSDPTTTALAILLSLSWQTYLIIWSQIFRNNGKGTTNQQYQQTSLSLILFVGNIWYLHNFGKQFSLYLYSGHYIAATDSSWPKFLAAGSPLTTTTAPPADTVFITKWIFGLIQNVSLMMHLLCSTLPY